MAETLSIISDENSSRRAGPSGIGGWLILVLLKLWIGAAARLAAAITFLIALRGASFNGGIAAMATHPPAGLLPAVTAIVVGVFGAVTGYLIARKNPKGPLFAKILLLLESGYYAMRLLALFLATGPRPVEPFPAWLRPAAYLLTAVLCVGYLFRSRRVDNTFYRQPKPVAPPVEETDPRIARIRPFEEFKPGMEPGHKTEQPELAPVTEAPVVALEADEHESDLPAPRIRPWTESSPAWLPERKATEVHPAHSMEDPQPEAEADEIQPAPQAEEWEREPKAEELHPASKIENLQPEPQPESDHPALPAWLLHPEPKTEEHHAVLPAWLLQRDPKTEERKSPLPVEEETPEPGPEDFQLWLNAVQTEPEPEPSQPWPETVEPQPEFAELQPETPEEEFLTLKAHISEGVTEWLSLAAKNIGHPAFLQETSASSKPGTMEEKLLKQVTEICDHAYAVHLGQFPSLPNTVDSRGSLSQELEKWAIAQAALRLTRSLDIRAAIQANGPFEHVVEDSEYLLAVVERNSSEDSFGQKIGLADYEGHSGPEIAGMLILQAQRDMFEGELWSEVVSLAGDPDFPDRFRAAGAKAFQDSLLYWRLHLSHSHDDRGLLKPVGV